MYFEIYQTMFMGDWRWRLRADAGPIIAESRKGHASRFECEDEVNLVKSASACRMVYR